MKQYIDTQEYLDKLAVFEFEISELEMWDEDEGGPLIEIVRKNIAFSQKPGLKIISIKRALTTFYSCEAGRNCYIQIDRKRRT